MPKASSKGADIKPVPAGIHHAVCYSVIDLGTQPSTMYSPSRKVLIVWELPHETMEFKDDRTGAIVSKPRAISHEYTLSLGKKANLRRDLESWRGRAFTTEEASGFEVGALIGANCQVNVTHKPSRDGTRTFANVTSIVPLGRGQPKMTPHNPTLVWDIPQSGPFEFPKDLPEWIVTKIKGSDEYQASVNPHHQRAESGNGSGQSAAATDEANQAFQTTGPDEDVPF